MTSDTDRIAQLDDVDAGHRREALSALAATRAAAQPPAGTNVNMHMHSFFSYNADGWSPSHLAWAARSAGLYAAGLCDFDVLDGQEEFLEAGEILGLRATVNLETRAYVRDFAKVDINSPGEPGVTYIMGGGFARPLAAGSPQAQGLAAFRRGARERNEALIQRINPHIPDIALDYARDVVPLTPAGVATERHIVRAYVRKAEAAFPDPATRTDFWARVLVRDLDKTAALMGDLPAFEEAVRSRLAKKGGFGYEPPSVGTFPPVDVFLSWVASCGAVPMATWLDGTSGGESDAPAFLECLRAKGARALNLIPDRNWNIRNPDEKALKIGKLGEIVSAAVALHLPINIGTELNKQGVPFTDDLDGAALRPHKEVFLRGARLFVGHSLLARYAGFGYVGAKADAQFGDDTAARNTFFERVGAQPPLARAEADRLRQMGEEKALAWFSDRNGAAR
jgi:hypothetical protein